MFKLPEDEEYFKCPTKVVIPKQGGGYHEGYFTAKFRYLSLAWINDYNARRKRVSEESDEEQIDFINEVLYGFEDVSIGDRELDDTVQADRDWLIKDGPYSAYFRVALDVSLDKAINGARGKLTKRGN